MNWRKLLLIGLMAAGIAFVPAQRAGAQVAFSIGFGFPGYYGYYPYYYRPYPYYGYYYRPYPYYGSYYYGPSSYWYGGHRYYRHHHIGTITVRRFKVDKIELARE